MALRRAAKPGIALVSMLADNITIRRGATRKRALLHVLQPASAMPGFPPSSNGDYKIGDKAIRHATQLRARIELGGIPHSICHIGATR